MESHGTHNIKGSKHLSAFRVWLGDNASFTTRLMQMAAIRRVAIGIALLVFCLQAIAVVYSYHREQNHQLSLFDASLQGWAEAALVQTPANDKELSSRLDAQLRSSASAPFKLLGYRLVKSTDRASSATAGLKGGDSLNLGLGRFSDTRSKRYFTVSAYYDTRILPQSLTKPASSTLATSVLYLRVDASHLHAALTARLWKSVAALILVTLLTLAGLLLMMRNKILQPLLDAQKAADRLQHYSRLNQNLLWETDDRLRLTFVENNITAGFGGEKHFASAFEEVAANGVLSGKSALKALQTSGASSEAINEVLASLKKNGKWEGELVLNPEHPGAQATASAVRIVAEAIETEDAGISGYRGLLQDNTEYAGRSRELEYQANHDQLTGLSNRRAFDARLADSFEQYYKSSTATTVCMLDLDQFKLVNDSCGHAAGDALLLQVAKLLESAVRSNDMVARVGGDEFCIVLVNCGIAKAAKIAETIRLYIKDYRFHWRGTTYAIGVSIGIVELSDEFETPADLVTAADACLYRSKRSGRDQIQLHSANDELLLEQRAEMESINTIKQALQENRFVLYFQQLQPCESSRNDKSGHHHQAFVEVLVRMVSDDGTLTLPDDFLPVAERFNLLTEIDRYICSELFNQLNQAASVEATQDNKACDLRLSVNLSDLSVVDRAFQSFLLESLEQAVFDTESLYFEIPESSMAIDFDLVSEFISKLADTGCGVIIDNFGYGSVSVSQIQGQPISALKLSSRLTNDLEQNHLSEIVLRGIVDAGPMLDVDLIAQHVENMNLELLLLSYEFDFLQGFYYAEPQKLVSIAELQALTVSPALMAGKTVAEYQEKSADASDSNDGDDASRHAA